MAVYLPIFCSGGGHTHICLSLCRYMRSPELGARLFVPAASRSGMREFVTVALPGLLASLAYRVDPRAKIATAIQRSRFRDFLKQADLAYLWAATPESVYEDVKAAGIPIFVERINCHRATSVPILDSAYRHAGLPPLHGITVESLAEERRKLALADWIFAPSPPVRKSLVDSGVCEDKILLSSYGWDPGRVKPNPGARAKSDVPTFLFVGLACIRKGAHLLLGAWADARVDGRLVIAGEVLPEVRTAAGPHLEGAGVNLIGHVEDVARVYSDADVFVFPTYEEGSPLVTYEALAHGLPVITTPMGAGEIVRDGVEGIVCEPDDREALVDAIRKLAHDRELRDRMSEAARARADKFTWRDVGARRRALVLKALSDSKWPRDQVQGIREPSSTT